MRAVLASEMPCEPSPQRAGISKKRPDRAFRQLRNRGEAVAQSVRLAGPWHCLLFRFRKLSPPKRQTASVANGRIQNDLNKCSTVGKRHVTCDLPWLEAEMAALARTLVVLVASSLIACAVFEDESTTSK